jgi:hypothetical protein
LSTHKHFDKICIIITILALLVTVLFMNGQRLGMTAIVDEDAESYEGDGYFTANDLNGAWDTEGAVYITLTGDGAVADGNGVYSYDGDVYISGAGKYVLSGTLDDGSIIVDAYDSSKVYLMLDGVDISCADDAGFKVEQADKVFLTLAEGSVNTITCGDTYSDDAASDKVTGAIHSHDDLTINGSGSLTVTADYKHGIVSKDDLVITGGTVKITAKEDGIHVNDAVKLTGADITINAEDDGIHSDLAFVITGGSLTINGCYEGIEAVTIDIEGGDTLIYPTDDGLNANGGSGDMFSMGGGPGGGMGSRGMTGTVSGDLAVEQMPDFVSMSGNMPEFMDMPDVAGNQDMLVNEDTDDRGSDTADESAEDKEDTDTYIHISGGTLTVINDSGRDADGIDSNGDIIITGGDIRVSMVNSGGNSALDYASESGGVAEISGGTVIACGNYSMAEQFDESSVQASILYTNSEGTEAGTTVTLEDEEGNVLMTYEVPQSFSSVNMSCPELTVGETYTMIIGDNEEKLTVEEISASYGDATGGGFGGMHFGGAGMQPRGDFGDVSGNSTRRGHGATDGRGMARGGDRPGMPMDGSSSEDESTAAVSGTDISDLDADVWKTFAVSVIFLIIGLGFALFYKRRH